MHMNCIAINSSGFQTAALYETGGQSWTKQRMPVAHNQMKNWEENETEWNWMMSSDI